MNPIGHVDIRVPNMAELLPFYEQLLPALGFTRTFHGGEWKVFAAEGELPSAGYFALTEDKTHRPNTNRVGFWAGSRQEVDRIADLVKRIGGKITDGPKPFPYSSTYYAVFFEDACGNPYEVTYRVN
jgi:predicted enzyme related to lactoylglutathione lyase